jgi:hypothetical protein
MSFDLNNFDPFNVAIPTSEESAGGSSLILKIPGPDSPLIVKLLPEPTKGRAYLPVNYYKYAVGPNAQTDSRSRPSRQSLGLDEKDQEDKVKWEGIMAMSAMKKANPTTYKNDPKFKAIQTLTKLFEAKEAGWAFVIEPEATTIKALKLNKSMINSLFGRKGEGQIKAIPSVVENLHKKGKSPYKIDHQDCWLKIWKTGEGLATEYFIEHHAEVATKVIEGETIEYKKPITLKVNEKFLSGQLDAADYPDPIKFDLKQVFTPEETAEFIETQGNVFPERFGKSSGGKNRDEQSDESRTTVSDNGSDSVFNGHSQMSLDDIPF